MRKQSIPGLFLIGLLYEANIELCMCVHCITDELHMYKLYYVHSVTQPIKYKHNLCLLANCNCPDQTEYNNIGN